jgi:nucleoside phosphorylase
MLTRLGVNLGVKRDNTPGEMTLSEDLARHDGTATADGRERAALLPGRVFKDHLPDSILLNLMVCN